VQQLWQEFREGKEGAREQLITHYLPLAERVARRIASGLPRHIDLSDLVATGSRGLIKAIDKYDVERNPRFEAYATLIIKGAIIDELRASNWAPRSVIQKATEVSKASAALERELGRQATDEEMAAYLELTPAKFAELLEKIRPAILLPLHESSDGELSWSERIADERAPSGADRVAQAERRGLLERKLKSLPVQQRKVLYLYYYEDLMLREIGQLMGVSESRISQIHTKALLHLRGELEGLEEELRGG